MCLWCDSFDKWRLLLPNKNERQSMTFSARFKIQDVGSGPRPIDILAVADVQDESLTQNTEKASSMELHITIDADETNLKIGDIITANGHFVS